MRSAPHSSFPSFIPRLGFLAVVVAMGLACSSAPPLQSKTLPDGAGSVSSVVAVDPIGSELSDALTRVLDRPSGRVERRTSLGVVGFEVTMISTLTWDARGGALATTMETSGPLAQHSEIVAILASRKELAQANDRSLGADDLLLEQRLVATAVVELVGELRLAADAAGRLVGERIVGDSVERITVEIERGHLFAVTAEFGHAGAGGRDEWRFSGG